MTSSRDTGVFRRAVAVAVTVLVVSIWSALATKAAEVPPPLQLETKISLGEVSGRIDHLAVDLKRQRLFIAELGNNSLGIVDLAERKLLRNIPGLSEPQGVGFEPATDVVYVANAGDGSVRLYQGADYNAIGTIELGKDADNVRVDATTHRVIVGYGRGALAIIDPATRQKVSEVQLREHPESFQLTQTGRIFVNLPDESSIGVVDSAAGKQIASWPQNGRSGNYPMALYYAQQHVLAVFRHPAVLTIFAMGDGAPIAKLPICEDSDDVFVDAKRRRAYVSCGAGFIDVVDLDAKSMTRIAHIPTAPGARTSLFMPELDRFAVAVPARGSPQAAVWIFRPAP